LKNLKLIKYLGLNDVHPVNNRIVKQAINIFLIELKS